MISVVVSAFNEEKNLPDTIRNIIRAGEDTQRMPLDIIIVNDGSHDRTKEVIGQLEQQYPFVRSIHFEENRGIGAGILAALDIAKYDKMCNFPGDNACSPHIMKSLFANSRRADFLISYIVNTEERGYKRHLISALYSFIYLLTFNLPVKYVNGSQLYPVEMLKTLHLRSKRYSLLAEVCIKLTKKNITFFEIEDYIKPNQTKSSALRLVNFKEVIQTFLRLVYEIHFKYRDEFNGRARRILPNPELYSWVQPEVLAAENATAPQSEPEPLASNRRGETLVL